MIVLVVALIGQGVDNSQQETLKRRIDDALKQLGEDSPEIRERATRKLIELDAAVQVEPLTRSNDPEVRERSQRILRTIALIRQPVLKEMYKKAPALVEDLGETPKKNWLELISASVSRVPKLLSQKERRFLAEEVVRVSEVFYREGLDATVWIPQDARQWWLYVGLLEHEKEATRENASRALSEVSRGLGAAESEQACLAMIDILGRARVYILQQCAQRLDSSGLGQVVDALLVRTCDPEKAVRWNAAAAFEGVHELLDKDQVRRVVKALMERDKDPSADVRGRAINALGKVAARLERDEIGDVARMLLKGLDGDRWATGIHALAELSSHLQGPIADDTARAMVARLGDSFTGVTDSAARGLEQLAPRLTTESAIDEAVRALDTKIRDMRRAGITSRLDVYERALSEMRKRREKEE